MQMRKLGQSPLSVAPLALGSNVFGWNVDEKQAFVLLDAFVDHGFNLIDTADTYSSWVPGNKGGESETIIGKWLKSSGKRDKVLIATKVAKWQQHPGLSPININEAADDSLRRLGIDHIDLYQAHEDDPKTPLTETLHAFAGLIEKGKVRVIGASNYSAERFEDALKASQAEGLPRYESMQPEYNLMDRKAYEDGLEPVIRRENVGVISYYSLASGFLSGKYRDESDLAKSATRGGAVKKYMNPRGMRVLDALDEVAGRHQCKPSQAALAWLMARPGVTAPIASATTVEQLGEIARAAQISLSADDIALLDTASAGRP